MKVAPQMLTRFCLYGFLKNQRYFEPFFMLALLTHGISFTQVGVLIAVRALTLNIFEIPSGAMADLWGRRRCMIGSFAAYVVSFLTFAWAPNSWWLFPAMVLYGVGDSFRTGTHKAMIFEWLRLHGRQSERTRVYGVTRSWSKYGSAVSSVLSAICVLATGDFRSVFLLATIPYLINIVNFLGYPPELDGLLESSNGATEQASQRRAQLPSLIDALRDAWQSSGIRRLIAESMSWEGVYNAVDSYLQPALLVLIVGNVATEAISAGETGGVQTQTAHNAYAVLAIAGTYAVLALLSGFASRLADRVSRRAGSDVAAARLLWKLNLALFALLGLCDLLEAPLGVVLMFVAIGILQNVWRPILISRFDDHSDPKWSATVLSIESQSQRIATFFIAPAVGYMVDFVAREQLPGKLWPIAVVGICAGLPMLLTARPKGPSVNKLPF